MLPPNKLNMNIHYTIKLRNRFPASILYKSIAGRYRPVSYPDGPITARYRFVKNAYWVQSAKYMSITISNNLDWGQYVSDISSRAAKTLCFLRRNFSLAPNERLCAMKLRTVKSWIPPRAVFEHGTPEASLPSFEPSPPIVLSIV